MLKLSKWKVKNTNLAKISSNELLKPEISADCIRLTRAATRSWTWGDISDGRCKISCRMYFPANRDPEHSRSGLRSLHQHWENNLAKRDSTIKQTPSGKHWEPNKTVCLQLLLDVKNKPNKNVSEDLYLEAASSKLLMVKLGSPLQESNSCLPLDIKAARHSVAFWQIIRLVISDHL